MAKRCSIYVDLKDRPVCPLYFNGQSKHIIWYSRCRFCFCFLYLPVCGVGFSMSIVWCPQNVVFELGSLNSFLICLASLPLHVDVVHFSLWARGLVGCYVFVLEGGFVI
jgi:hypothetical protein